MGDFKKLDQTAVLSVFPLLQCVSLYYSKGEHCQEMGLHYGKFG